jgi:hypothetical protein
MRNTHANNTIYTIDITAYHMSAPLRKVLMGSIPNIGYKRIMLKTLMPMMIIIETVSSNKNVPGNINHQIIARIMAETLQRKIQIIKVGIKLFGASFLSSVIGIKILIFLIKLMFIEH